jgi:hypothetical protein
LKEADDAAKEESQKTRAALQAEFEAEISKVN